MAKKVKLGTEPQEILKSLNSLVRRDTSRAAYLDGKKITTYTKALFKERTGKNIPKSALKNEKVLRSYLEKFKKELQFKPPIVPKKWNTPITLKKQASTDLSKVVDLIKQMVYLTDNLRKVLRDSKIS